MNASRKKTEPDPPSPSATLSTARTLSPCHSDTASSSVAIARGCPGLGKSRAFKIVSLGPAIAITRVALGSGEMPIQMSLIGRLLGRGRGHLRGERRRGERDLLRKANFFSTRVRHYFPGRPQLGHSRRRRPLPLLAPPVR